MLEKTDYLRIGKLRTECVQCGVSLVEDGRHVSVLSETATDLTERITSGEVAKESSAPATPPAESADNDAQFSREDYCLKCWKELKERAYFSFWMGKRDATSLPPKKLNRAERNVVLAALFESLLERHDEENDQAPHLFFLAHLLMKFKVFKWLPAEYDTATNTNMLRFVRVGSDDEIRIPDMEMSDEMIVRVKGEIENYLAESTGLRVVL
jgi:hypothetical protein